MHNASRWHLRSPRSSHLRARFQPEFLESRQLLSTATLGTISSLAGIVATPATSVSPDPPSGPSPTPSLTQTQTPPASALTPTQVRKAYGFDLLSPTQTGAGVTIAIVDAYNAPNIVTDVKTFDTAMGLDSYGQPSQFLKVVNQNGENTLPTAEDPGWALETSLDVQWAHAIAPGANILLVEANSDNLNDLLAAVQYASKNANVVSMSWGANEFNGETADDSNFSTPGVTFVAASGDSGGSTGPLWPSVSPNVLAVGGTTLFTGSGGLYLFETAWSGGLSNASGVLSNGSGGGVSQYESLPDYQKPIVPSATNRTTPDVAYVADPNTGVAVYNSYQNPSGWVEVGGTSVGAPQWAALIALADQGRVASNQTLGSQQVLTALYGLAAGPDYENAFHDIIFGFNAAGDAGEGYDLVTGLGSPIANVLVPSLASVNSGPTSAATPQAAQPGTTPRRPALAAPHAQLAPPTVVVVVSVPAANTAAQPVILFIPVALPALPHVSAEASNATLVTSSALVPQAPSSAPARPVQPLTLSTGVGDRLATVEESALEETQAPVPDVILERDTPPPPPAPRPDEVAPAVPLSMLRSWDTAVKAYVDEAEEMALPLNPPPPPAVGEEQPSSALETTLRAGAAVALWGTWEVRSRLSDRRRRKVLLPESPSIN